MNSSIAGLLKYLIPFKGQTVLSIVFNLLATLFSVFSFFLIAPILKELFETEFQIGQAVPFSLDPKDFLSYYSYTAKSYIVNGLKIEDSTEAKGALLILICVFLSVIYFLKNVFGYLAQYLIIPVRNGIVKNIREEVYQKIIEMDVSFFANERKGDVISKATSDISFIERSIVRSLEAYIKSPVAIIISLAGLVSISWKLTIFILFLLFFIGLVIGRIAKVLKQQSKDAQKRLGKVTSIIDETVFGIKIIKALNGESFFKTRLAEEDEKYKNKLTQVSRRSDLSSPLTEFLGITVMCVLIWYGGKLVFDESLEPELFFVFIGLFYNVISPAKSFSKAFNSIRQGKGALERINYLLDFDIKIKDSPSSISKSKLESTIVYDNVNFGYIEDVPVLKNFSLEIKKGESVALVGTSGAGKSTLADLLPRFYDVSAGAVKVDGVNIKDIKLFDLRSMISVVSQEAILFNDTIYNNIVFGLEGVTKSEVIEAAKKASSHDFIIESENGYETIIGDRGAKLSGGQKQRITIARAILRDPQILILDEATSALDSESEKLVQEALLTLMKDRTSLVIAHRLSTIQHCDKIVVMEYGEIIEQGSHDVLLSKNGKYAQLVKLQSV